MRITNADKFLERNDYLASKKSSNFIKSQIKRSKSEDDEIKVRMR